MDDNLKENFDSFLTLAEASKLTGYHQDYLGFLCRSGKLQGYKIGRNWTTTKRALDEFIKNYKNGVSEVLDETGTKIPVKVEGSPAQVSISELPWSKVGLATQAASTVENAEHSLEVLPAALNSGLELRHLKRDVIDDFDKRVQNLSDGLAKIEEQAKQQEKVLQEQKELAKQGGAENEPLGFVVPFVSGQADFGSRQEMLRNNFASNISLTETQSSQAAQGPAPAVDYKKLYRSFAKKNQLNFSKAVPYALTALAIAAFAGTFFWNSIFQNIGPSEVRIVYQSSGQSSAASGQQQAVATTTTTQNITVNKTINQLLGFSDEHLYNLIDNRLNQYLAEGKFTGQQGEPGVQGPAGATGPAGQVAQINGQNYAPITYVQSPGTNGPTGSVGGYTDLSATNFYTTNETVGGQLTVNGGATFNGGAHI